MATAAWHTVLNWKQLPAFGEIHRLDDTVFERLYYSDHHIIQHLAACLLSGLKGEFPPNNCRIIGAPGVGKTTFLYHLKSIIKKDKVAGRHAPCFLKILDCTTLVKKGEINDEAIPHALYQATIDYFSYFAEVWKADEVKHVTSDRQGAYEDRLIHLWDFYIRNLRLFPHRLFLALDGIDTIPESCMIPLAVALHNAVPHRYVRMWLSIRDVRYDMLHERTRMQLNTLFPEPHIFPRVELGGVIDQRIRLIETNEGDGKNPFSEQLCSFLSNFYNGDLRQCMGMLVTILRETSPKGLQEHEAASEAFIQEYIDRMAVSVLFAAGEIPNLFDVTQGSFRAFPLEKDVLMAVAAHPRKDALLRNMLREEIRKKLTVLKLELGDTTLLSDEALDASLKYLESRGLIEYMAEGQILLTPKGWETQKMADTEYYITTLCRQALERNRGKRAVPEGYWDMARIAAPYQDIALEKLLKGPI